MINETRHRRRVKRLGQSYKMLTKFPPAYQIDLLVDDSDAIANEGTRFRYQVLQIQPDDQSWVTKVLAQVE